MMSPSQPWKRKAASPIPRRKLLKKQTLSSQRIFLCIVISAAAGCLQMTYLFIQISSRDSPGIPLLPEKMHASSTAGDNEMHGREENLEPRQAWDYTIPKILIFTHYRDLLTNANLTDNEEIALASNIRSIIRLHPPHTEVRFLLDKDCIESINRTYPALVQYFENESEGMYKADICRGSALYETGGYYLDVDVGVRHNLWLDLRRDTEFVTSRVHIQSNYPNHFFQAVLGAAPRSPIIYKYLELFHDHYTGKERLKKGPLGVILLRRAWDRVYNEDTGKPPSELYQEVLYHKKLFPHLHPAPTWGTRRACHFVVVAEANHPENVEFQIQGTHFRIPFYSRVAGSRMCPRDSK